MTSPTHDDYRHHAEVIFHHSIGAANPQILIQGLLQRTPESLSIGELTFDLATLGDLYFIAMGKAAGPMTKAFLTYSTLQPRYGLVALPEADMTPLPEAFSVFHAGHPFPNAASIAAGVATREMLVGCSRDNLVVVLISGGGSALFELPKSRISLSDLNRLNRLLLASGLPIEAVNSVRSAISQVKAGGLARLAAPARTLSLILSDVPGDHLGSVASGPTVLRRDQRETARDILHRSKLWSEVPQSIRSTLANPEINRVSARRPINILIGGNGLLVEAAQAQAKHLGYKAIIQNRRLQGEARIVGRDIAHMLLKEADRVTRPTCFIYGGETTVTVRGQGVGGRNQELALSAAQILDRHPRIALASMSSDGIDGPTDAAGAIVDGQTYSKIRSTGVDPDGALVSNDSYHALAAAQALYRCGPTGTNVADLTLAFIYPGPETPQKGETPHRFDPYRAH